MARRQRHEYSLAELVPITDAFLAFVAVRRKVFLTRSEEKLYFWILRAWETKLVRRECERLSDQNVREHTSRIERLQSLFHPEPVRKQPRLLTEVEDVVPKLMDGSHKTIIPTKIDGESGPLSDTDVRERLRLLRRLLASAEFLIRELWVHEGSRRDVPIGKNFTRFRRSALKIISTLDPHGQQTKEHGNDCGDHE